MTIRLHKAPNPRHAYHSADVLSPAEQSAQYQARQPAQSMQPESKSRPMRWGDVEHIKAALMSLRERHGINAASCL